jgi:hypothetical protein
LPSSPTWGPRTLPFGLANPAAFREDLLDQIITGERPTGAAPIFRTSQFGMIREQGADVSFQCRYAFFKRCSGHQ